MNSATTSGPDLPAKNHKLLAATSVARVITIECGNNGRQNFRHPVNTPAKHRLSPSRRHRSSANPTPANAGNQVTIPKHNKTNATPAMAGKVTHPSKSSALRERPALPARLLFR
ncbi:hypothetical protein GCM10009804_17950 [Kribbella hippodromi]|uniref:Uncharacterized protein n=1 Tax=Kribbella hippodromi TaxID=434347 RepID=A0ABN2CQ51_9ACTN